MDDFYIASVPEPVRILGLQMLPFSLGHVILLHRIESAFVVGGEPTLEDLAASVLICHLTFKEGRDALRDPQRDKFMRRWHYNLTHPGILGRFRKAVPLDFLGACRKFTEYVGGGTKIRKYDYDPEKSETIGCPMPQLVKVYLLANMNFTEPELLDRSWALCMDDFVTLKAIKNEVQIREEGTAQGAMDFAVQLAENLAKRGVHVNGAP